MNENKKKTIYREAQMNLTKTSLSNQEPWNFNSAVLNSLLFLSLQSTGNAKILEISSKHMFITLALLSTVIKAVKSANALLTDYWETLIFSHKSLLSSYLIIWISE